MNTSLSKFAKDTGLPKSSVYARCKELKLDVAHGLTPSMVSQLEHEFGVNAPAAQNPAAIQPEVLPDGFFQQSKLATVEDHSIQLPGGFDPTAMVKFFDGVVGQGTDTGSLVAIADMALNAVERAMDTKLNEQQEKLTKAQKDAESLKTMLGDAKTNLKVKALESRILAGQQTTATQTTQELFAELMAMGKPAAAPDTATSP